MLLGISRVSLGLEVDHHGKFAPKTPDQTVVSTMRACLLLPSAPYIPNDTILVSILEKCHPTQPKQKSTRQHSPAS
jgi:hypothetical protein